MVIGVVERRTCPTPSYKLRDDTSELCQTEYTSARGSLVVVVDGLAKVLELVDWRQSNWVRTTAAAGAARVLLLEAHVQPERLVRLGREAGAADVVLVVLSSDTRLSTYHAPDLDRVLHGAKTVRRQRLLLEHIHTLELAIQLKALETRALVLVGGHRAVGRTRALDDRGVGGVETGHRGGQRTRSHRLGSTRNGAQRSAGSQRQTARQERHGLVSGDSGLSQARTGCLWAKTAARVRPPAAAPFVMSCKNTPR